MSFFARNSQLNYVLCECGSALNLMLVSFAGYSSFLQALPFSAHLLCILQALQPLPYSLYLPFSQTHLKFRFVLSEFKLNLMLV